MLRIEKIFKKEEIEEEIGAYQALIPDGNNFKATMLIMYPDVEERRKMLEKLNVIENKLYVGQIKNYLNTTNKKKTMRRTYALDLI